jgi:type I restriction enzyme S subunit
MTGMADSQVNITQDNIKATFIPLPPLAEQKAIVEKVDKLMNNIDQLEQQIKHRKQLAENLMQTVLREAFE